MSEFKKPEVIGDHVRPRSFEKLRAFAAIVPRKIVPDGWTSIAYTGPANVVCQLRGCEFIVPHVRSRSVTKWRIFGIV
jgi:hypothetical protein